MPNFHQVNDRVFRGAQPHPTDFASLAKLGIKTVIDLRGVEHERTEEKLVNAAGMHYIHVPLDGSPGQLSVHHRLDEPSTPNTKIETAYHNADKAIQRVVDLLAA